MHMTYAGGIGFLLFSVFMAVAVAIWVGWLLVIGVVAVLLIVGFEAAVARFRVHRR